MGLVIIKPDLSVVPKNYIRIDTVGGQMVTTINRIIQSTPYYIVNISVSTILSISATHSTVDGQKKLWKSRVGPSVIKGKISNNHVLPIISFNVIVKVTSKCLAWVKQLLVKAHTF